MLHGRLTRSLEKRRVRLYLLQFAADALLILWAHSLAAFAYFENALDERTLRAGEMAALLYLTIALYNGCYSREALGNWKTGALRMAGALGLAAALFSFFAFYTKSNAEFSRVALSLGLAGSFTLLPEAEALADAAMTGC